MKRSEDVYQQNQQVTHRIPECVFDSSNNPSVSCNGSRFAFSRRVGQGQDIGEAELSCHENARMGLDLSPKLGKASSNL